MTDAQVEQIQTAAPDDQVINAGQDGIADAILQADIFCGHAKVPMPWKKVVENGRLRWIQSSAAGMDHCLTPEVIDSSIRVTSASGLFANQVAEQTFALLFGLIRKTPLFQNAAARREFIRRPTNDFHGKTVGIIGFGGNGRRIAQLLAPFGNTILATDAFPVGKPDYVHELLPPEKMHDVLSQSDVVILCLPLLESTYQLIDEAALNAMRPGTVLINVARGRVVDEPALIQALDSGHLSAAGLDVTHDEPLPSESPLWDRENVMISPHVGAQSARRVPDTVDFFCRNLEKFRCGERLINEIDKHLGFPRPEDSWISSTN